MDYETIEAGDFGRALSGLTVNLLVRDVGREVAFLTLVFAMTAHRASADYAIMTYGEQIFKLCNCSTHRTSPLLWWGFDSRERVAVLVSRQCPRA